MNPLQDRSRRFIRAAVRGVSRDRSTTETLSTDSDGRRFARPIAGSELPIEAVNALRV